MTDAPGTYDREFRVTPDMIGRLHSRGAAMVADTATIIADVTLGAGVGIWFGAIVRGDDAPIRIGPRTNIQDCTIIHADIDDPMDIGADVTVGHGAILHGRKIGDSCLIGMGCMLLAGTEVGDYSIVAAGAVVPENTVIPPGSMVAGVPAKIRRQVTEEEKEAMHWRAGQYVERARSYLGPEDPGAAQDSPHT